ncbi:hypothetical protein BC831DRAFT_204600 [Entophlyctis helioformis]|nr:hypothetical protein BC831DRAFT_204600 [Entophlyctis helioformis]
MLWRHELSRDGQGGSVVCDPDQASRRTAERLEGWAAERLDGWVAGHGRCPPSSTAAGCTRSECRTTDLLAWADVLTAAAAAEAVCLCWCGCNQRTLAVCMRSLSCVWLCAAQTAAGSLAPSLSRSAGTAAVHRRCAQVLVASEPCAALLLRLVSVAQAKIASNAGGCLWMSSGCRWIASGWPLAVLLHALCRRWPESGMVGAADE